jgi:hypothetical protein
MPDINVDFSSVEADEFSIVPPGEYKCTIVNVKYDQRESEDESDPTFPYLNIDMTIDEGQEYAHSHLYTIASFSPKGDALAPVRRTKFLLLTLGVDLNGVQKWQVDSDSKKLLSPDLTGKPVTANVNKGKDQNGNPKANVFRLRGDTPVATKGGSNSTSARAAQFK